MVAYLLADLLPTDMEGYQRSGYLQGAVSTATAHGGKYIARGGEITVLEGDWEPDRMVIIEFPTMKDLRAWYDSPEYQEWAKVRRQYAPNSKLVALEGV
jgi:uncharacterized protein (DUF1330 family)